MYSTALFAQLQLQGPFGRAAARTSLQNEKCAPSIHQIVHVPSLDSRRSPQGAGRVQTGALQGAPGIFPIQKRNFHLLTFVYNTQIRNRFSLAAIAVGDSALRSRLVVSLFPTAQFSLR